METWMWALIAFLVLDTLVLGLVLRRVNTRRRTSETDAGNVSRDIGL